MEWQALAVLGILAVGMGALALERGSVEVVCLLMVLAAGFIGVLTPGRAFAGFSHPAVITIGAMFVVSAGIARTGLLDLAADRMMRFSRGDGRRLLLVLLPTTAVISAFVNNTPIVLVFIPVAMAAGRSCGLAPSRVLMPLSFAAILGGSCTLIGTSTNVLVAELVETAGYNRFGMFEFARLGVICAVVGLLYLVTIGRRLLPERGSAVSLLDPPARRTFLREVRVPGGSSLVGRPVAETPLGPRLGLRVIQLIRGEQIHWPPFLTQRFEVGDLLLVRGDAEAIARVDAAADLAPAEPDAADPELREALARAPVAMTLAEIVIPPNSPLIGRSLEEIHFRARYDVPVIAIQRHDAHLRDRIAALPLRVGDLLLVLGDDDHIAALGDRTDDFLLLEGKRPVAPARHAAWAIGIVAVMVALISFSPLPMAYVAVAAAVAMVIAGCLTPGRAFRSIDARVLILTACMLSMGTAMESSGAADLVASTLSRALPAVGPVGALTSLYGIAVILTSVLSNQAAAILLVPIAFSTAVHFSVDPRPFLVAVSFGASASFATPFGYQTNTLVYGPGGYRFADFIRVGLPLNLALFVVSALLIPLLWPLH